MIPKPKKLLFSSSLYSFISALFLLGLFFYAISIESSFLVVIIILLIGIIFILFSLRQRFVVAQAQVDLKKQDLVEKTNLMHAEIKREQIAIESSKKKIISYAHLKDLTEKLSLCLSLSDTSKTLSSLVTKLFEGGDLTTILYIFHSKTGELGLSSSQKGQMQINIKSKKGDIFDEWVVKTLHSLLIENTRSDFRFDMDKINTEDSRIVRSLISAPLMVGNRALGILRIDSPQENSFATEDLRFLTTISDLGAVAIESAQLYETVEELAIKDGLTSLYLRRHLLSRMSEELSRQLRRKKELSLLMIDLDKFKDYNDKFGHMAGDIVLRTVSMILQDSFKDAGNLVSRYGGEEFVVLLPDCSKKDAIQLAENIRKKIKKQEIILRKQKTGVTVSIGIATFPTDAQIKDDLIYKADSALYKAKSGGRDKVCAA